MRRLLVLLFVTFAGCVSDAPAPLDDGPYVLVLGTAQDGGLPQIGCRLPCCDRARRDPANRRLVSSLLLVDPATGRRWLFDATPDLPEQVEVAHGHPSNRPEVGARPPLFDGVFLTHAHMGHYTGLLHFGREAYGSRQIPVFGTERLRAFLAANGPWSQLVEQERIRLMAISSDEPVDLGGGLVVRALTVPHRDEFSDTLAFLIEGPRRTLLYLPDIDKWDRWETPIEDVLATVDVALLDGTFAEDGEIPGRALAEIPHPFLVESLSRFAPLPAAERAKIRFTHLNHTNAAADRESTIARRIRAAGMAVARDGEILRL